MQYTLGKKCYNDEDDLNTTIVLAIHADKITKIYFRSNF